MKPLFEGVSLGLDSEDRIGVVGANGSGKTTLLRLIARAQEPDSGQIVFAAGVSIGYLPQNPPFEPGQTVLEATFAASDARMKLLLDYERACQELGTDGQAELGNERLMNRVSELAHELEASGAWEMETNSRTVLSRLGITDTAATLGTLSGGQRKRVALAHALIESPDLLILDEPTNHLDAETIAWLETYLARYRGALVLVTHDRYFLDRVTGGILEIDRGTVQTFDGNYSYYLEKKEEQELNRAVETQKRDMLASVGQTADHMGQLVDDLLNLARVGKRDVHPRATPLTPLVQRVIADLKPDITERRIEWRVDPLPVV